MTKTIRIVITSLDYGGTERHLLQVLPRLKKLGWKVIIHTLRSDCAMLSDFERVKIDVVCPKKINFLPRILGKFFEVTLSLFKLYKILKKDKNCVVHFFLVQAYVLGMMVALKAKHSGPKLMSRRSLNYYQKKIMLFEQLEKEIHNKVDAVLANSEAVKKDLLKEEVLEEKLHLIYNGIDLSRFNELPDNKIRKELGINKAAFIMTIVANLIPYKGHSDLLDALAMIKNRLPDDWVLLCVGKYGEEKSNLEEKLEKTQLKSHVKFLGLRSDVHQILLNSNVGLLCSHEEGMPNAVMEYMAARLPVVATNVGGTVELVDDSETGILVPPKDPEKYAKAILKLIEKNVKNKWGEQGRKKIEEEYSIEMCVKTYDNLYKKMMKK
jgi:glycosyltransferase involved in cell wall biosynthesis